VLRALIGGWQANGILSLYCGLPFTPSSLHQYSERKRQSATQSDRQRRASHRSAVDTAWFDVAAFVTPGQYQFGNSGVNFCKVWHEGA